MKPRIFRRTLLSLSFNLAYALYHWILGFSSHSWWFITLGVYYIVLSIMRAAVLQMERRSDTAKFAKRISGGLFLLLSFCLIGTVILSVVTDRGIKHHEIAMITVALYSFAKVTIAVINLSKAVKNHSPAVQILRNISLADAFVSIFALQRSMLVSFPGMAAEEIKLFNILTGSAVCFIVFILGLNLIGGRRIDMAKSKLVKANEKIAEAVVGSYKKVEGAVVSGYTKIEDKFVEKYLTHDGESVEDAKARLKGKE